MGSKSNPYDVSLTSIIFWIIVLIAAVFSMFSSGDDDEADRAEPALRQTPVRCSVDVDSIEAATGMDEIIEAGECIYWAGWMGPDDVPSALCQLVLTDIRAVESNVKMVSMRTRDGERLANCMP